MTLVLLQTSLSATAIVMRHDSDPRELERLAAAYAEPLVWIRYRDADGTLVAEGVLVADRWVLTAAHVADGMTPEADMVYRNETYAVGDVCLLPGWTSEFEELHDLALVELASQVPDARPARVCRDGDEEGREIVFVGRGMGGTGLTGPENDDQELRAATNRVAEVGPKHLAFTLNAPQSPLAKRWEGISGPGDSGGPALIADGREPYVLGISSAQDYAPTGGRPGRSGVLEYYSRVSAFSEWIDSVLAGKGTCAETTAQGATAPSAQSGPPVTAPQDNLFAVRFTTGPSWDAAKPFSRQPHSAEHSANLRRMRESGLVVLGGRFADTGMILVRALDEAAVRAELARDPSIAAGTFRVAVDEYRPFFSPSGAPIAAEESADTPEAAVVRKAIAAFNAHDAEAFAALCADDLTWLSVDGDSLSVDGEGCESIRDWLLGYFESLPDVRSEVTELTQSGAHVAFRERVTWTAGDGAARTQEALAVYEVRDGEIRRVWYFATQPEAPQAAE